MLKGVHVQEVVQSIRERQGEDATKAFASELKRKGGVDVTFTVARQGRERKHRWASAKGVVVAVRLMDAENAALERRLIGKGTTKGLYIKHILDLDTELLSPHRKKKAMPS
jgi:hypothetical protein